MKTKFIIILATILSVTFVACKNENIVGPSKPMIWETNIPDINKDKIAVTDKGGVYVFKCKNYTNIWIYGLFENGKFLKIEDNKKIIEREWYSINFEEESTITVSILSNSSGKIRTLEIGVQSGNTFDSFIFEQD